MILLQSHAAANDPAIFDELLKIRQLCFDLIIALPEALLLQVAGNLWLGIVHGS